MKVLVSGECSMYICPGTADGNELIAKSGIIHFEMNVCCAWPCLVKTYKYKKYMVISPFKMYIV